MHMPPVHHECSTGSIDHTCRHPNLGCADPTITSRKIPSLFTPGSHQNDSLTNLCNHHTSCSLVNLQWSQKLGATVFHRVAATCFHFACRAIPLGCFSIKVLAKIKPEKRDVSRKERGKFAFAPCRQQTSADEAS